MGNRATVIFTNKECDSISPAVYLHWNGGAESIYPFLDELDRRNVRADQNYECARFIHIVGEYFNTNSITNLSLGVVNGPKSIDIKELMKVHTDPGDNGFYIVDRTMEGDRMVRRFLLDYKAKGKNGKNTYPLVEQSKEWVEAERVAAYAHTYNIRHKDESGKMSKTIADVFDNLTKGKEIEL